MSQEIEKRVYEIAASPQVLKRIDRLLTIMQMASNWGSSREFGMWLDGDGPDRLAITSGLDKDKYVKGAAQALNEGFDVTANDAGYSGGHFDHPKRDKHKLFQDDGTVKEWVEGEGI